MIKKSLISMIFAGSLFANQNIDYDALLKPLQNNQFQNLAKEHQQQYGNYDNFYNSLLNQTKLLDSSSSLLPYLQEQKDEFEKTSKLQQEFKSFTIFYFFSEDTSIDLIRNFSHDMERLKEIDENIDSLLLTRGLIGGDFDSMAKYVQNLQNERIEKLEVTFHPWAYDYFNIDKVPAFALSYCKKDFRFKECEHKYLVRGEMSLTNFFEIISDENPEYKKYYQKLIEAK